MLPSKATPGSSGASESWAYDSFGKVVTHTDFKRQGYDRKLWMVTIQ